MEGDYFPPALVTNDSMKEARRAQLTVSARQLAYLRDLLIADQTARDSHAVNQRWMSEIRPDLDLIVKACEADR